MYKSAIIFLLGSLVMLLPFGNSSMNIFSNAMSLEMNPYMNNEDYYQRYERFYKDNSFREAYYNYHKQQHYQHDQQQQISYNDYYYDDNKKTSYSYNNNKDKSKDSNVDINKIKCINTNININGVNAGNVSLGNKGGVTEEGGYLGAYSSDSSGYNGGEGYYDGYNNNKKGFECIINNNNTNTNFKTIPPEPSKATLNVTKLVTCEDTTASIIPPVDRCAALEQLITEDQFLIEVTDDNPLPSQFPGSPTETVVTLGAGSYIVTETDDPSVLTDITTLLQQFTMQSGGIFFIQRAQSLTGDCTQVLLGGQATGTIEAGESQTCNIENSFTISRQMA